MVAGKLRACIWPDYFSISYKNQKTGQLEGLDIDLAREFANDMGVAIEYVPTHFGVFIRDLQANKCDIAMFGVGVTEARAAFVNYSQPYLRSGMYAYAIKSKTNPMVTNWESMDQRGVVVCVQKGTYMERIMADSLQHARLLSVVQSSQREVEVRSGRADVFIADYPYSLKIQRVDDWAEVITPQQSLQHIDYAYAVNKGEQAWLARVNYFVQRIKADGRLAYYAKRHNLTPIVLLTD